MNMEFLRKSVQSRDFALADIFIVAISGVVLYLFPSSGVWPLLIALVPWGFRLVAGVAPFRRTSFDWLIAIFVITAGSGYWASYDKATASTKFLLIIVSVLLYYALSAQPEENLIWVSASLFCIGVGLSLYFFLTHDFIANPRKLEIVNTIGRWMMDIRPSLNWTPIHPNYISGIAAITTPFVFYPFWKVDKNSKRKFTLYLMIALGLGVVLFALLMTTSRGIIMAITSAAGVWVLWRLVNLIGIKFRLGKEAVFPSLVLIYLCTVVAILYLGPATSGGNITSQGHFGTGSRAELFARSVYFISDFPFTGGGLGSFPGLYSQYILGVPSYYLPNGHNVFLDVFIEQGVFGGLAFLFIYLSSIWLVSRNFIKTQSPNTRVFTGIIFFALIVAFVHGMVDDYLYYENGTVLSVFLAGLTVNQIDSRPLNMKWVFPHHSARTITSAIGIILIGLCLIYRDTIRSVWYSNLGAVQMAQVELVGFPTNEWAGPAIVTQLGSAEDSFHSSLEADSTNRTANHRLGMIAMLQWDFPSAADFLLKAYRQTPDHRGIMKSLGYCYVWLGEMDKAEALLKSLPEAKDELDAYVWWWGTQSRADLAKKATIMVYRLESLSSE